MALASVKFARPPLTRVSPVSFPRRRIAWAKIQLVNCKGFAKPGISRLTMFEITGYGSRA
jgi:hypothetical protein